MEGEINIKIIKEIAEIAKMNEKIKKLTDEIEEYGLDLSSDDIDWTTARIISGLEETNGGLYAEKRFRLDNSGLVDDTWYARQHAGYCGDDFYGVLYFKTEVPGEFVEVDFQC